MSRDNSENLSRRNMIAAAVTVAASLRASRAGAQSGKVSQSQAGYQPRPNNGQSCGACVHFQPPGACQLVDGAISPQGWCSLFSGSRAR